MNNFGNGVYDDGLNKNQPQFDQKIQDIPVIIDPPNKRKPEDFFKKANIMLVLFFNLKNTSLFLQKDGLEPFLQLKIEVKLHKILILFTQKFSFKS